MFILISGLLLAGTYALIAMGLNLQYGVARIMNLANGEMLVAGAFAAFWFYTAGQISPVLSLLVLAPVAYVVNWLIFRAMLLPLVRRAKSQGALETDAILATFGLSFVMVGLMTWIYGGDFFNYRYLADPVTLFGGNFGQNRIVAFGLAVLIGGALWIWLNHTRTGLALRAVAKAPESARLVGINVHAAQALAFGLGGAITAMGGALVSMFLTLDASVGVLFTMKALVIVIMGGVGDIRGTIIAALILGIAETAVARLIDPGLTLAAAYALFLAILLFRPQGLFGRASV